MLGRARSALEGMARQTGRQGEGKAWKEQNRFRTVVGGAVTNVRADLGQTKGMTRVTPNVHFFSKFFTPLISLDVK